MFTWPGVCCLHWSWHSGATAVGNTVTTPTQSVTLGDVRQSHCTHCLVHWYMLSEAVHWLLSQATLEFYIKLEIATHSLALFIVMMLLLLCCPGYWITSLLGTKYSFRHNSQHSLNSHMTPSNCSKMFFYLTPTRVCLILSVRHVDWGTF